MDVWIEIDREEFIDTIVLTEAPPMLEKLPPVIISDIEAALSSGHVDADLAFAMYLMGISWQIDVEK